MLLAFLGKEKIKADYLNHIRRLQENDAVILSQHKRWSVNGYGSAAGCIIGSNDLTDFEKLLSIPAIRGQVVDSIFIGLPLTEARNWPYNFLSAVGVGADLSRVFSLFAEKLLIDPRIGLIRYFKNKEEKNKIKNIALLYKQEGSNDQTVWSAAANNIYSLSQSSSNRVTKLAAITAWYLACATLTRLAGHLDQSFNNIEYAIQKFAETAEEAANVRLMQQKLRMGNPWHGTRVAQTVAKTTAYAIMAEQLLAILEATRD